MKVCNLSRYWAVRFMPKVTVRSTAGPQECLEIRFIRQLHIQSTWRRCATVKLLYGYLPLNHSCVLTCIRPVQFVKEGQAIFCGVRRLCVRNQAPGQASKRWIPHVHGETPAWTKAKSPVSSFSALQSPSWFLSK